MLKKFWRNESGQSMVDYALCIALIAITVIAGVILFGTQIKGLFLGHSTAISSEMYSSSN